MCVLCVEEVKMMCVCGGLSERCDIVALKTEETSSRCVFDGRNAHKATWWLQCHTEPATFRLLGNPPNQTCLLFSDL